MKIRITYRLFLAILAVAVLSVVSMFLIGRWSIDRGFRRYMDNVEKTQLVRLAGRLETGYAAQESWDFLKKEPEQWFRLIAESFPEGHLRPPMPMEQGGPREPDQRPPFIGPGPPPPEDSRRFVINGSRISSHGGNRRFIGGMGINGGQIDNHFILLDEAKRPLFAPPGIPSNAFLKPLIYKGRTVGYLGLLPHRRPPDELQRRFLKEQGMALSLVAGTLVLLAASFSLPLARRLIRPIKALAAATDRLAAGEFSTRVTVISTDELGQLARGFNSLAQTLEKNEQTRRQWVADISHELRTPLAILRGEVEAIQDGIRPANPDSIDSLHGEVVRLERLVNDLYQLSLSDLGALTYRKEELELEILLSSVLTSYRPQFAAREIAMEADIPQDGKTVVFGDPERMRQLFANLFDNTLKYTDPGGMIAVRLACRSESVTIDIEDSAPGVPNSAIGRLFERLYRVEASRNRAAGGAGLGLAICRNIVEAHAGAIEARHSSLGGLWIRIELPLTGRC
ncbi:MAG: ATP-binding protein [Oryzomonas sp.]|uniref:ATP-binding protein n=1 Tax=Oryzomonas sp. TaxID=2855186 RepID=UPI00284E17FA|nr:ATP-binding protein [Oryzomonas sp.]MDR3581226.1 ATP-binding protein [Oryzomonas sp.]